MNPFSQDYETVKTVDSIMKKVHAKDRTQLEQSSHGNGYISMFLTSFIFIIHSLVLFFVSSIQIHFENDEI